MIVVFSGNDGSGKSTLSKLFYQRLKGESAVKVAYRRGFEYFALRYILKLFPQDNLENKRDVFLDAGIKNKTLFYRLSGMVWPLAVWLDYLFYYIYAQLAQRNKIVIFDRFAIDSLIGWEYFGYGNAFLKWLYLIFPKPGIAFLLDAPAEVTYKRSGLNHKFPEGFYLTQRERYLQYAGMLGMKVVSTNQPLEVSFKQIWDYWQERIKN